MGIQLLTFLPEDSETFHHRKKCEVVGNSQPKSICFKADSILTVKMFLVAPATVFGQ